MRIDGVINRNNVEGIFIYDKFSYSHRTHCFSNTYMAYLVPIMRVQGRDRKLPKTIFFRVEAKPDSISTSSTLEWTSESIYVSDYQGPANYPQVKPISWMRGMVSKTSYGTLSHKHNPELLNLRWRNSRFKF